MIQKSQANLRLPTIIVGTLISRNAEVTETVGRKRVDTVALQKVRYRNEGVKTLRGGDFEYRLYWKDNDTANGDVGLIVKRKLANQ